MMPIDAIAAVIWAVFLSLVTVVLAYFGFVVADRQELAVDLQAEDAAEPRSPDASSTT